MNINNVSRLWYRRIALHGLSIQRRLPLLIFVLLCSVILTFGFASYYGVKKATLEMGKKRLRSLTDQLGAMFTQSSQSLHTVMLAAARHDTIRRFIVSDSNALRDEALAILNKLRKDSTWKLVELLNAKQIPILRSGNGNLETKLGIDTILSAMSVGPDSCKVGRTYAIGDSMYYPVIATITDKKEIIGYLVSWRSLSSSPKGLEQLSQLMGTGATLYIGNLDGSLWTNLIKPVSTPPIDTYHLRNFFEYNDSRGKSVIAAVQPIATTQWLVLVEFSVQTMLEAATNYLHWIFIFGGVLIALGIFITWMMSYSIIKPLNQLTSAAIAVAAGDYSSPVKVSRLDELGKLTSAFNAMAAQIRATQLDLEKKVTERTDQLKTANQEMEAFTYSVSHDLRAPLRAIIAFTSILEDEYSSKLDDEAKRLTSVIKINTIKMGKLIDDLLAFSKVERDDIIKANIDCNEMVGEIINGLDVHKNMHWNIQSLPDIKGDKNAMRQVWINLISNAIKYSNKEIQPHIEVGTCTHEGQAAYYVKDNGVGFDQQYAQKLFKVFQRLHHDKDFEGTGVGLAIVEKIISKHGGKVWAEGEKGKGAKFFFTLPGA